MDGFFQQTKPLDELVGEMTLFSFDLKSATETLVTLFEILFDQLFAFSCVNSCLAMTHPLYKEERYGAVVFPGEPGLIDGHISTLIEQMGTGCSVVPMILGEVIRSLSDFFLWCAALLKLVKAEGCCVKYRKKLFV